MEITTIALILSIAGLVTSLFFVGGIVSLAALVLCIRLFIREKSIRVVRALAIAAVGVAVPAIMYLNTYGFGLPKSAGGMVKEILAWNYGQLGIFKDADSTVADADGNQGVDAEVSGGDGGNAKDAGITFEDASENSSDSETRDDMVYLTNMGESGTSGIESLDGISGTSGDKTGGSDEDFPESDTIFESLDSIDPKDKPKGGIINVAASDDDMPSYGGMPLGTLLVGRYFREDDHNCNPILVLRNSTGTTARYECRFTARDADGNEMAISDKTVEAVRDGSVFVFEGRFDKRELGGGIPDSYEFLISKREPYENEMADQVSVYTRVIENSAIITAENESDKKVKVDAYVLFFDGKELVDCMWMIPQNTDEVCLDPGTMASIRGDAYYRFDRVETFYTAYEAVGE